LKACIEKDLTEQNLIRVFRPKEGSIPDFDFGSLYIIGRTYDQRRDYVINNSDVMIILGGGEETRSAAEYALSVRKPLIPIGSGDPSEAAVDIWQKMMTSSHYVDSQIGLDDLRKIGPHRSNEQIALNAIILAENLVHT
jgi:hypothetical protein